MPAKPNIFSLSAVSNRYFIGWRTLLGIWWVQSSQCHEYCLKYVSLLLSQTMSSFLSSFLVELHCPSHHGGANLHQFPAAVVCFRDQLARSCPAAALLRVNFGYDTYCRNSFDVCSVVFYSVWSIKCICLTNHPFQVVNHSSDVPSFLCVHRPQHGLRRSDLHQPLHWDQRQHRHLCSGTVCWWGRNYRIESWLYDIKPH